MTARASAAAFALALAAFAPRVGAAADSASALRHYVGCDGFAEGVRAVVVDQRPKASDPWREVSIGGRTERVSVTEGFRVMYSYPRTLPFAKLHVERSEPGRYAEDKRVVTAQFAAMARDDPRLDIAEESHAGLGAQTLTKPEMAGTTLGMTQLFADEDGVIVTIYFLNQEPAQRRFGTRGEFVALRDDFVRGYAACVGQRRAAAVR